MAFYNPSKKFKNLCLLPSCYSFLCPFPSFLQMAQDLCGLSWKSSPTCTPRPCSEGILTRRAQLDTGPPTRSLRPPPCTAPAASGAWFGDTEVRSGGPRQGHGDTDPTAGDAMSTCYPVLLGVISVLASLRECYMRFPVLKLKT